MEARLIEKRAVFPLLSQKELNMEISSELLAAYAKGKVTEPERSAVRRYLTEHPEELESVIIMMDDDYDLNFQKIIQPGSPRPSMAKGSVDSLCCCEAPEPFPDNLIESPGHADMGGFPRRLGDLLDEMM